MKKMDEIYMRRALELAKKGEGFVAPNPMVGCVIVKNNKIIGEGYHEKYGGLHAERNALKNCKESAEGATLYVTLEPCCHYGKTPPCTEIIIEKKIKKVVIGCKDDNPLVENKGIKMLEEHGIEVEVGILETECRKLNEVFFHYITSKMPYIVTKYAMSLDGKIATYTGDSKWITSEEARKHVHKLRKRYSGIMVGINTVLSDDPMLNCRIENGSNPTRIILDNKLRLPLDCNIAKTAKDIKTIIITSSDNEESIKKLNDLGIDIIVEKDINKALKKLGEMNIDSILVEGGGTVHSTMLENKLINKVYAYIAPILVGGKSSPTPISGNGFEKVSDALNLYNMRYDTIGKDMLIIGYADYNNMQDYKGGMKMVRKKYKEN